MYYREFNRYNYMLNNYLRIAFRTLIKHRFFSLLNISGLAIALTTAAVLLMYVSDELSYDSFHEHSENTYRLTLDITKHNGDQLHVDQQYFSHYRITLIAGRDFLMDDPTAASARGSFRQIGDDWIINESAVSALGYDSPENAFRRLR